MSKIHPVSQNHSVKNKKYLKPSGIATSLLVGSSYGFYKQGADISKPGSKIIHPIDVNIENFLSKTKIGKSFVDFMQKDKAKSAEQLVDTYKRYSIDKKLAKKGALVGLGVYVLFRTIKKGVQLLDNKLYR